MSGSQKRPLSSKEDEGLMAALQAALASGQVPEKLAALVQQQMGNPKKPKREGAAEDEDDAGMEYDEDADGGDEDDEDVVIGDWEAAASDAITIHMVSSEAQMEQESFSFHPEFTHQIFHCPKEKIVGYRNPQIDIFFNISSLDTYVSFKYDEKAMGRDAAEHPPMDVMKILTKQKIEFILSERDAPLLSYPITKSRDDFITGLSNPFTPLGDLVREYFIPDLRAETQRTFRLFRSALDPEEAGEGKVKAIKAYHLRLQALGMFMIENMSYIDVSSPAWDVYTLYEWDQHQSKHKLVGYTTVYSHFAMASVSPNRIRRTLSQIIILPLYQRQGHCTRVLEYLYDEAREKNSVELNIEDPSDDLIKLRDALDFRRCLDNGIFSRQVPPAPKDEEMEAKIEAARKNAAIQNAAKAEAAAAAAAANKGKKKKSAVLPSKENFQRSLNEMEQRPSFYQKRRRVDMVSDEPLSGKEGDARLCLWTEETWKAARRILKINPEQLRMCYEMFKFMAATGQCLPSSSSSSSSSDYKPTEKEVRLDIKRRLYRKHREGLEKVHSLDKVKKLLNETYGNLTKYYQEIIDKVIHKR